MAEETLPDPKETLRQILSMMYSTFLQNQALQAVLVSKGFLKAEDVDLQYKALSDVPTLRKFREEHRITDSELLAVLSRHLRSFEGPIH